MTHVAIAHTTVELCHRPSITVCLYLYQGCYVTSPFNRLYISVEFVYIFTSFYSRVAKSLYGLFAIPPGLRVGYIITRFTRFYCRPAYWQRRRICRPGVRHDDDDGSDWTEYNSGHYCPRLSGMLITSSLYFVISHNVIIHDVISHYVIYLITSSLTTSFLTSSPHST